MLFNSFAFLVFFIIVTSVYFLLPHKYRWVWLLAASCYFYMAFVPVYILILGGTIVIDYFAGIWISKSEGKRRKMFLVLSLISNIGVLAVFKYYNFLNENLTFLLHGAGFQNPIPFLSIILPLGLSFHTFQAMSYTLEVYRGNQQVERHFGIYALYVMFYPQLVAGPIERPQNMLHQFHEKHEFDYDRLKSGIALMVWGLFKKMVIADRLGLFVNQAYDNAHEYQGIPLIIATFFFAFQIYCDFSGYSDIALGAARTIGFKLMLNFNYPFISTTVGDYWRRWHISLSTWFNDYLFLPLNVAKRDWGPVAVYYALFITFFLSGLWHGAAWTFIIWGSLHGLAIIFEIIFRKQRKKLSKKIPKSIYFPMSRIIVFLFLCFTWIFFRAYTVSDAFYVISNLFANVGPQINQIVTNKVARDTLLYVGQGQTAFLLSLCLIVLLEIVQKVLRKVNIADWVFERPKAIRYGIYYVMIFSILVFAVYSKAKFIYFQF